MMARKLHTLILRFLEKVYLGTGSMLLHVQSTSKARARVDGVVASKETENAL